MGTQSITCRCSQTVLELTGSPIMVVECLCDSCRRAASTLEALPGAPPMADEKRATRSAMYRKDRVACSRGARNLREFRLKPDSKTRRIVATCCNSAMMLDFTQGHWIDVYAKRWPLDSVPVAEMRTMVGDLPPGTPLPDDIPNGKGHGFSFFRKLLWAWVAMGFRTPKIEYVEGTLTVAEP